MSDPAEDEDTDESRSGWLGHRHTRARAAAQRKEVAALAQKLHGVALGSADANVRDVAAKLLCAQQFLAVFEGKEET